MHAVQTSKLRSGRGGVKNVPAVPTGLTATPVSSTSIVLDWNDNSGSAVTGYKVYRSLTSGSGFSLVSSPVVSGYSDTVTEGTTYYYKVAAYNSSGDSAQTSEVSATSQSDYVAPAWTLADLPGVDATLGAVKGGTAPLVSYYAANDGTPYFTLGTITAAGGSDTSGITINNSTGEISVDINTPADSYSVRIGLDAASSDAESDWLSRSQGAGVVWAHRFDSAAEITTHSTHTDLTSTASNVGPPPDWVDDTLPGGTACKAMQFIAWGAKTVGTFPAALPATSEQTLTIDDATNWPTGSFTFRIMRTDLGDRPDGQNIYYCRTRAGNILYCTYQPQSGQSISATQLQYPSGSNVGGQTQYGWQRPFSALNAAYTGMGVRDLNRPGLTYRDFVRPYSYLWGYGYYGHPDYVAANGGNFTYSLDGQTRQSIWDGSEFYIQFRVKIDPRFWTLNTIDPASESSAYSRKLWLLQTEITDEQQIMANIAPSNRYQIPATRENPLALVKERAIPIIESGSFQPGSPWAATATGNSSMQAGAAWEYTSNEWITFLLHVIPGKQGAYNTYIELKATRPSDAAYPAYTTVFASNVMIPFETVGEYGVNSAPGYSCFMPTGYLNSELGNIVPSAAYYTRWTQIIFSHNTIPAPGVGA